MSDSNGKFSNVSKQILECIEKELVQLEKLDLLSTREGLLGCVERAIILEALRRSNGRKGKAAQLLGINVKTLYNKLNGKSKIAQIVSENREDNADSQEIISAIK